VAYRAASALPLQTYLSFRSVFVAAPAHYAEAARTAKPRVVFTEVGWLRHSRRKPGRCDGLPEPPFPGRLAEHKKMAARDHSPPKPVKRNSSPPEGRYVVKILSQKSDRVNPQGAREWQKNGGLISMIFSQPKTSTPNTNARSADTTSGISASSSTTSKTATCSSVAHATAAIIRRLPKGTSPGRRLSGGTSRGIPIFVGRCVLARVTARLSLLADGIGINIILVAEYAALLLGCRTEAATVTVRYT